jgi:hypothetical protein
VRKLVEAEVGLLGGKVVCPFCGRENDFIIEPEGGYPIFTSACQHLKGAEFSHEGRTFEFLADDKEEE